MTVGPPLAALGAREHRDPVAPPQLPRDVPIADVLQPVLVGRAPSLRDEADLPLVVGSERRLGERLHLHEPLVAEPGLDDRVAAVAAAQRVGVRLDLLEQPLLAQHSHDPLAGFEPVYAEELVRHPLTARPPVRPTAFVSHRPIFPHDQRHVEPMARSDLEVGGVVRGGDLHEPASEQRVHRLIGDDRDGDAGDRQPRGLPHERPVARVVRVHRQRCVAEHRFGPGGGDREIRGRSVLHRIADVEQLARLGLPGLRLLVRQSGEAAGAPMDYPMAPVDQPLLPQPHEHLAHGPRVVRIEREPRAAPIARAADHLELLEDGVPRLANEGPHPLHEPLAAEVETALALARDDPLHHVLRRDACVVGPREPHRRHVGRWDDDDVRLAPRVRAGRERAPIDPAAVEPALDVARSVLGRELEIGHSL